MFDCRIMDKYLKPVVLPNGDCILFKLLLQREACLETKL
jgi:hypothetical protein